MRWLILVAALSTPAFAKTDHTLAYPADRVFPTAVRFLRVDEHATITDKDADSGYVMFDFPDDGKTWHGALEVVKVTDDPPAVKVIVTLEDRPPWMEEQMLEGLEQKLRDEIGDLPDPPKPPPEPAKPAK